MSLSTPSAADTSLWAPGAGIFVGYSLGKSQGIQVGLEAFALGRVGDARYQSCGHRWSGPAFGPLAQLSLVGGFRPQLTVAGTGLYYGEDNFPAVWGEAGVSYVFREGRFGIHTGLVGPTAPVHLNLHHEWLANSTFVGMGARTEPYLDGLKRCAVVVGRPLRTDASENRPALASSEECASKCPVARAWLNQAKGELESVPAFVNLAIQLLYVGAPDDLVERALSAAEEEMEHARLCVKLAREADSMLEIPFLQPDWSRAPLPGEEGIERLAVESWLDGIVNEGASALASEAGLRTLWNSDTPHRRPLERLAREERGHLKLASDILTYAVSQSSRARASVEALGTGLPEEAFYAPPEELAGFAPAEVVPALMQAHARLVKSAWVEADLDSARLMVS